uniref:Uncharacterized protein n=1 Tax=Meloidogyne floridensis TaxID=298350 RepID=A0A915NYF7_9BILA
MGLFLGMSLVSVIELATFLWKITWIFISKKRREHMIAKKCRDEEREKHLQATMEFALQQRRFAASIGRLAASQQQQAESKAPIAKISFSNPLNYSSSSSFEYQQKQRKPSVFDNFFGLSKRKFSSFRKASKNNNFVDSIISNRVHGTTPSSSSEDENEDNEAKYCKKEKKNLGKLETSQFSVIGRFLDRHCEAPCAGHSFERSPGAHLHSESFIRREVISRPVASLPTTQRQP